MRWLKVTASLLMLMLMSFLTTISPLLSQSSLSHNLSRETAEEIHNQATQTPPIQLAQNSGGGRIRVVYHEGTDERSRRLVNGFRENGAFDKFAESISNTFNLPTDKNLTITFQNCGQANAFYNPTSREIVMCSELWWDSDYLFRAYNFAAELPQELAIITEPNTGYVFLFVLLHEFGHALIDILDIPVVGREEDAVDQFSTMFLLVGNSSSEARKKIILSTITWFVLSAKRKEDEGRQPAYWGQHPLEQQRMYNIACLWYGNNPEELEYTGVTNLLRGQAPQCPQRYQRLVADWNQLLKSHLRNRNSSNNSSPNSNSGQNTNPSEPNRIW
ncbi:DUF4344 domain-containing metallopeptidase [Oscillatoria acuminata]|uniref:Metallopeptidase n=1 Tax=Oscillatoria acuminata PCC 6304 TaxID=56110 RepID=K9THC3_9CYAN|nr:DUF4344 domain-containing metallopeptidase [Oscillatoria acuminata]AFY81424.1 hypothetical protein Oscil6304_1743 [Oscillatoria acuminata PCC 6304]